MTDQAALMNWVHRQNIERYLRLLGTHLTPRERLFIEQRIVEEQDALGVTGKITVAPGQPIAEARRP